MTFFFSIMYFLFYYVLFSLARVLYSQSIIFNFIIITAVNETFALWCKSPKLVVMLLILDITFLFLHCSYFLAYYDINAEHGKFP